MSAVAATSMSAPIEILLVEDSPGDIRFSEETLKDCRMQNNVTVVRDGEEALEFLRGCGRYVGRSLPDLVMLDLQLPKIDGTEVLAVMQEDPELRAIPVVVLTVTDYDKEMLSSLGLPATCCVVKPLTVEKYLDALRCYSQFGLAIVRVNPPLD